MISRFQSPGGVDTQQLEVLLRLAIFKPANDLVQHLLQVRADQIDAAHQPRPGLHYKGREKLQVQGVFGCFELERDYYYEPEEKRGHFPADHFVFPA